MSKAHKFALETPDRTNRERQKDPVKKIGKKRPANKWSESDYSSLIALVRNHGEDWTKIASQLNNKTAKQCMQKFKNSQRSAKNGNWTNQEDQLLFSWVERYGPTKWTECSKEIKGRCGKQCRERWVNILNPNVKKGNWSDQEQDIIFNSLATYNTSWSLMSNILPGRTENSIKNYFYSSIRRLKSNNLFGALKSTYVTRRFSPQQALESVKTAQNDLAKLNRLSQKICMFLFEKNDRADQFLNFLISVLFNSEAQPLPFPEEPKRVETSPGFVPVTPKHLVIPSENVEHADGQNGRCPQVVIDAMRVLQSNPGFSQMIPYFKMLEQRLPGSQIVRTDTKTQVHLTKCWNCETEICKEHA